MLLVDKYRPQKLDEMDIHLNYSKVLKNIVKSGDFTNLLFHGPNGGGKKTRIYALIRELFPKMGNLTIQNKDIKTKKKSFTITTLQSQIHIEVTPSDCGNNDRYVVTELIKEMAQTTRVNINLKENDGEKDYKFKIVVLNEVDLLSNTAQAALRRTMEKYSNNCKLILCCTSISRVISPIISRCLCIRIPLPTHDEIKLVLNKIAKAEGFAIPKNLSQNICDSSERNLRRAILLLENCKINNNFNSDNVSNPEWDLFIKDIAKDIIEKQSPKALLESRAKFYTLLTNCIPPETIFKRLTFHLITKDYSNDEIQHQIIKWASFYEHRMKGGTRPIFHLEAFVAKFMFLYKEHLQKDYKF